MSEEKFEEKFEEEKTFKVHVMNDSLIISVHGMTAVIPRSDLIFDTILSELRDNVLTDSRIKILAFGHRIAKFEDFLTGK